MADEPDNLVLVHLRGLDAKIDRIADDLNTVKGDLIAVKTEVGGHTRTLDVLRQDVRMIRAAVNDIARTDVTSGEVEALHHDLNRVEKELAELAARVEIIEGRDGPRRG
jgi:archaellum component FlaC